MLAAVARLQPLLDHGEATAGLTAVVSRGGIVLSRPGQTASLAEPEPDPRFRLTFLGGDQFGLSLRRLERWELLPFQGAVQDLVDVMNTALAHWASDW
ncbi:MAG: hypothetical protein KGJ86_15465 [Chloroflexota bacterium]|nr:hypothetical protein [Chloroflexota bacterium]